MVAALEEFAPAKINLALHVVGRRADGYHTLDTLVAFADLGDRLTALPAPDDEPVSVAVEGPFADALRAAGPAESNLVLKAARALAAALGRPANGLRVVLDKQLPLGAGLGGGSADAAAALRLLNRAWAPGLSETRLAAIAVTLGADVPMCLASLPARATGTGEKLSPQRLPSLPLVLAYPGESVSTGAVFRRFRPPFDAPLMALPAELPGPRQVADWLRATTNGLRHAARAELQEIGHVLGALAMDPGCLFAQMTGSGSACYGLFPRRDLAERAAARMAATHPGWWVVATETGAGQAFIQPAAAEFSDG